MSFNLCFRSKLFTSGSDIIAMFVPSVPLCSEFPCTKSTGTNMYLCQKAYGGMEVHLHAFFTLALDGLCFFSRFITKEVCTAC
jgi:hypothetical protein